MARRTTASVPGADRSTGANGVGGAAAPDDVVADLLSFIHRSPTPRHCVAEAERRLEDAGFVSLDEAEPWKLELGGAYRVARQGAVVAWRIGSQPPVRGGLRLIGAHTDSPNLRLKPQPDVTRAGYRQVGVEVYGGALTYTWLDRDLGLAGAVMLQADGARGISGGIETRLVWLDRPLLRVPSLAIHLNRDTRNKLELNDQEHLVPVLGLEPAGSGEAAAPKGGGPGVLARLLGEALAVDPQRILSWDLSLCDVTPPTRGGQSGEFLFAPRLDNQAMCHAALTALEHAGQDSTPATAVVCLYDHEEVGSGSLSGAAGPLVEDVLRRLVETEGPGAAPGGLPRAIARSHHASADMAHAVHPNYESRHEPQHHPRLNGGPVLKVNSQQRYATSAETAALFAALCRQADVPCQKFVVRTDLPCGSTIGPIAAARLGIRTVDVGNPMLSMHSIREQAGALDHEPMIAVLTRFLLSPQEIP